MTCKKMDNSATEKFRLRLRFKVRSTFEIDSEQYSFSINDREVILKGGYGASISKSKWLTLTSEGFETVSAAVTFGLTLKRALEICSITSSLGVDTGTKNNDVAIIKKIGYSNDVHGLVVYPDSDEVLFLSGSASITQQFMAAPFFSDVARYAQNGLEISSVTENIILLLNAALMQEDPISKIVFAISAVEMLAQDENWTENQRRMLSALSTQAMNLENFGPIDEQKEVADAIKRSIHRVGLRQGVLRLLSSLGLFSLKKEWDEVYSLRSKLFHGLAPRSHISYDGLAQRTLHLCANILLTAIAREIPEAARKINIYPILHTNK